LGKEVFEAADLAEKAARYLKEVSQNLLDLRS
jgi:hypothetical protein